jgi:hypothetical protein
MSQFSTDNVNLKDGRTLTEALEGLGTGGNAVDLKDYAKASDVKEVKDMIEQLISDLKAGKYNTISEVAKVEEVK